jgi:hypothetical protein
MEQTKKEQINEMLETEIKVFRKQLKSKEHKKILINDLREWFDMEIKKTDKKELTKIFNQYLDDLYSYLLDYSDIELKERLEGLNEYLKEINKNGNKK